MSHVDSCVDGAVDGAMCPAALLGGCVHTECASRPCLGLPACVRSAGRHHCRVPRGGPRPRLAPMQVHGPETHLPARPSVTPACLPACPRRACGVPLACLAVPRVLCCAAPLLALRVFPQTHARVALLSSSRRGGSADLSSAAASGRRRGPRRGGGFASTRRPRAAPSSFPPPRI